MKTSSRILPIVAAMAIQMCIGIAYVWSLFQTGIAESIFGGDNAAANLTFSLVLFLLSIGSIIGGKLAVQYSTRKVIITGGIILAAGFMLASFVTASAPWLLWVSYGAMGGLGMGFTYSTTIACAQKWYPEKKGLVTGLIVSALGLGGVIFTPIIEILIENFGGLGVGEQPTFRVLGVIFIVVCTIGGLFMKDPPATISTPISKGAAKTAAVIASPDFSPKEVIRKKEYYIMVFAFMMACMGGLMMIGFAKPIAFAKGLTEVAAVGVLIVSLCNSLGRLFWGMASDKIGRKRTIIILLLGSGISSLLVSFAEGYLIFVVIGFIGFFYGGFLSNFPSLTAEVFGAKHMATNYGLVMMGFGIGAVLSSYIAGHFKNIASENIDLMTPAFIIAAVCAAIGIILMMTLKVKQQNK
ncbi:MAG: OFA family MFS transporter [Eubacteriales bacterium]|nr:OFA family MFS transporter [Eubacteriales bacterium]